MLTVISTGLSFLIAITAGLSAFGWLKATRADVPTEPGRAPGAKLGGDIVTRNHLGTSLDFHASYAAQSKWNSFGARWACVAAALTVAKEITPFIVTAVIG